MALSVSVAACWRNPDRGGGDEVTDPCDDVWSNDVNQPCSEVDLVCTYSDGCGETHYRCNADKEWEQISTSNVCTDDGPDFESSEDGIESSGSDTTTESDGGTTEGTEGTGSDTGS